MKLEFFGETVEFGHKIVAEEQQILSRLDKILIITILIFKNIKAYLYKQIIFYHFCVCAIHCHDVVLGFLPENRKLFLIKVL